MSKTHKGASTVEILRMGTGTAGELFKLSGLQPLS